MKIKSFKHHLNEAMTAGTDLEYSIEQSWQEAKPIPYKAISQEAAAKVFNYLTSSDLDAKLGSAIQIGAKKFPISNDWKRFGGTDGTPKSDVVLGEGDNISRLSIKMGDAQLMSGGGGESAATFYCVANKLGIINDSKLEKLINSIPNTFIRARTTYKGVDAALAANDTAVSEYNMKNKEMKETIEEYFNTNLKFHEEFIIECMSGTMKFGGIKANLEDKLIPAAEYVFCASKEGDQPKLHKINDSSFARKVIEASNLYVRFKSSSVKAKGVKTGDYDYWTVMAMTTNAKKLERELAKADVTSDTQTPEQLNNSIIKYYDNDILVEGLFSDLANKTKMAWDQLKLLWDKIINWMKKSVQNLLEFFGYEIDIHIEGTINWLAL
jgi:hypothetical protein